MDVDIQDIYILYTYLYMSFIYLIYKGTCKYMYTYVNTDYLIPVCI